MGTCDMGVSCAPANVPVPEQELPAEIALLDDVVICERDETGGPRADAHEREVLHELTAQGPGAD